MSLGRVQYIELKKPPKSEIFLILDKIRGDLFNPTDNRYYIALLYLVCYTQHKLSFEVILRLSA